MKSVAIRLNFGLDGPQKRCHSPPPAFLSKVVERHRRPGMERCRTHQTHPAWDAKKKAAIKSTMKNQHNVSDATLPLSSSMICPLPSRSRDQQSQKTCGPGSGGPGHMTRRGCHWRTATIPANSTKPCAVAHSWARSRPTAARVRSRMTQYVGPVALVCRGLS
jgi:hypothetical protein